MIGKYERVDGIRFDVIPAKNGKFQRGDEKSIGKNRLFIPVTEGELKEELKANLIIKI